MRSSISKLGIINLVRVKTGRSHSNLVDEEMELIYQSRYEYLLSMFPWSFATDTRVMERELNSDEDRINTGYRYNYKFPEDAIFLWDIYYDPAYRKYRDLSRWNGNPYIYLDFPIDQIGELGLSSHVGEIIGGRLHSDWSQMYSHFTVNKEIVPERFNVQFTKLLENAMEELINRGKNDDPAKLGFIEGANKRESDRVKAVVSNENKGPRTVPRSQTLTRMDLTT